MDFKETTTYQQFFNMLPADWQETILPFWETYKNTTKCYLLLEDEKPVAGGLVFYKCPPDMLYAKDEADEWLKKGYLYLGFIYVLEEKRGQNLGSIWLSNLKELFPKQNYWLTIEDLGLHGFYTKNGFKEIKALSNNGKKEVVYSFDAI
jgi:diamine N-acetyltransferase